MLDYLTAFSEEAAELNRQFSMAFPTLCFTALVETKKYKVCAGQEACSQLTAHVVNRQRQVLSSTAQLLAIDLHS